ncbi:SGNH/GDSL hydrolase family protein [Nocardia sp. NPDC052566]|uniref:SGNH/GDSL hydrolase family protein n=1 Tax=Nocardia sp. NPDC052566 TaxID=3364330 RepID=UPI0037CCA0C7
MAIGLIGGALVEAPTVGAEPVAGVYVALGESGAAGPLIPDQVAPLGCLRSDHNYPHLTAAALGLTLRDVTCSGAKIADFFAPQQIIGGVNVPQLDAVTADATIVTVDIGINDYVADGGTVAMMTPKYGALLDDIHRRAPRAKVIVVSKIERMRPGGCFPRVPIVPEEADRIATRVLEVNEMARDRAAAHDAIYVDTYTESVGHDPCAPEPERWAEGPIPESLSAPLHPNALGHRNQARILEAALRDLV